jgi:endo-1,4-beta-xylanase
LIKNSDRMRRWSRHSGDGIFVATAMSLLALGTDVLTHNTVAQESVLANTLRSSAQTRGLLIGAAVAEQPLKNEGTYSQALAREFNIIVPENAMKFGPLRPSRTQFSFADADAIVDFAGAHDMKVRGHSLVWHNQNPQWLTNGNFSRSEISQILKEHIQTVVTRYRGRIYAWDVVNEAIDNNSKRRETFWLNALGEDYIEQVFLWAREADPDAKLFYNDYGGEALGPKSDAIHDLLRNLKARGTPIDGVGLQSHFQSERPPNMGDVATNMKRLAALRLEIHVTEFDARMPLPSTEQKLQKQAEIYRDYLSVCLSVSSCKAFLTWGFTDKYSWIPGRFAGTGAALPFDESYRPKPAFGALLDVLASPRAPLETPHGPRRTPEDAR